jgi:hypothetical protein
MSVFISSLMSGWLPYLLLSLAALALLLAVPFTRGLLLTALKAIPAAALLVLGALALPLWWPVKWLVNRVPLLQHAGAFFATGVERLGRRADLLNRGEREQAAREIWPEARFPFLYGDVPDDIVRPLWEDGKLIGGRDIPWMADRHFSKGMQEAAGRLGLAATLIVLVLPPLLLIAKLLFGVGLADGGAVVVVEQFPNEDPVLVSHWAVWTTVLGEAVGTFVQVGVASLGFMLGWTAVSLGVGLLVAVAAVEFWRKQQSAPYEVLSKDAHVRWPYRAETRAIANTAYAKQVLHATSYLKGSPLFEVGAGTGTFRLRGDLAAPSKGQGLALDGESLFQHLMVFGGTGDGKTTAVLKPVLRQVMRQKHFGVYVTDAKGVLWRDAEAIAVAEGRAGDVLRVGTGEGELGVNICARLTPNQLAATLRSVLQQMGGGGGDTFWPDMAANIMRHMLTVGRAYGLTAKGQAEAARLHPYSLWWAYQAVLDEAKVRQALDAVAEELAVLLPTLNAARDRCDRDAFGAIEEKLRLLAGPDVQASQEYLANAWAQMAKDTKTGIVANVSQLMDGFAGAPLLRERFVSGLDANTASLDAALNGKIALVTLNAMDDGLPARLVAILLKTTLYREARLREKRMKKTGEGKPQDHPCLVVMDEVQEIVTVDSTSGLSDATFWNVARSTGLAGVFATQTVAALTQAMGRDAADNFLQQARSKIFLRSEEQATVSYACWCAGEFERNRVFGDGQWESLDQRKLVSGWSPFDPVNDDETPPGADDPLFFFRAARGLFLSPAVGQASARQTYEADTRFVPEDSGNADQSLKLANISAQQQAAWRAEDQDRRYRTEGNTLAPAMTPADFIAMGRWHAYAHIQRAGLARQDVIELRHEY